MKERLPFRDGSVDRTRRKTAVVVACVLFLATYGLGAVSAFADTVPQGLTVGDDPNDPIVNMRSTQSCSVIGLATSPATSTSGVHCDVGNTPFSLTDILNGTIQLYVGNSTTPSWNIINDTGMPITTLTLFYSGMLASNANIRPANQGGSPFNNCSSVNANGVMVAGCNDQASPVPLPVALTWFGGSGVPINGTFNLSTASFAHAGQDAGCFDGLPGCLPSPPVPEPSSLALLAVGIGGLGWFRCRRNLTRSQSGAARKK